MHYFIDGNYLSEKDAKISLLDLSVLRGFGVFDFLRTYQKKPFHLREHLLRLQYSAAHIGLELPYSFQEIETVVSTLLNAFPEAEAAIKILVTGGVSSDQFTPQKPSLAAFAYPLTIYPKELYEKGITVMTTTLARCFPMAKTLQYLPGIVAIQKGKSLYAKEALYVNSSDQILEGVTSNFFGIKQGILHTCVSEEVLDGITREVILQKLALPLPISYEPLRLEDIPSLEEAFITASNKEIMPVVQINNQKVGSGAIGPNTRILMEMFQNYTSFGDWTPLKIPRYEPSLENSLDRQVQPMVHS